MRNRLIQARRSLSLCLLTAAIFLGPVFRGFCLPDWLSDDTWLGEHPFDQVKLSLAPEYFYWREEVNGQTFVKENGFRIGLEASYKEPVEQGWLWADRVKIYGGAVEYDGGLQNLLTGVVTPFKSTTDYLGVLVEARYGYRYILCEQYYLDLMGGITIDFWDRHLNGPGSYDEYWLPLTAKAGVDLTPKSQGFIGSVGAKVPFYTYQEVDARRSGGDTFVLHPQAMVTGYAEAGYQFTRHFSVTAFFDSYWFRSSPEVRHDFFIANQPISKTFEAGAKAGWTF